MKEQDAAHSFEERLNSRQLMSDEDLIKKCDEWIHSLAKSGGKSWVLSIPVRYHVDPDMLFTELISRFTRLRSELQQLKAWKKSEMEIWTPILEYMQKHPDVRLGERISERVLEFLKERDTMKK